jgi:subtilisin family serine protease
MMDENVSAAVANLLEVFEGYLIEKYGLVDVSGNGPSPKFISASNMYDAVKFESTGESTPQKEAGSEAKETKNISQEESGLVTQALDTVCNIGAWKGTTLREMWEDNAAGAEHVKIIAKSQLPLAKQAKVVVAFYEGEEV